MTNDPFAVLDGVSFGVALGELFGLIGPDGAGKTTLFRLLATLIVPDGGRAAVDGFDIVSGYREIRRRVGYMPGRFSLYPDLSVEENLGFFAALFGVDRRANADLIAQRVLGHALRPEAPWNFDARLDALYG